MKKEPIEYSYADLTALLTDICTKIHTLLGPGYPEKIYLEAFYRELKKQNLKFIKSQDVPIKYEGKTLGWNRIDCIVERKMLVAIKIIRVQSQEIQALAEMISNLKSAGLVAGTILNFGKAKPEIRRVTV